MELRTLKRFYDREAGRVRSPGDVFKADEARAAAIEGALPGYTERVPGGDGSPTVSASSPSMENTKAELIEAAESMGVEVKSGWTKAEILAAVRQV